MRCQMGSKREKKFKSNYENEFFPPFLVIDKKEVEAFHQLFKQPKEN